MNDAEAMATIDKAFDNLNNCGNEALFNMRHMIDLILMKRGVTPREVDLHAKEFIENLTKDLKRNSQNVTKGEKQ